MDPAENNASDADDSADTSSTSSSVASGGSSANVSSKPTTGGRLKAGLKAAGKSLSQKGQSMIEGAREEAESKESQSDVPSYRHGGKVRKTGIIKAHRGEEVVRKEDAKKVRKLLKRSKGKRGKGKRSKQREM